MTRNEIGWYSEKQARTGGVVVYETPDGGQVEVTEVTITESYNSNFNDAVCVGPVTKCIRPLPRLERL